MVKCVLQTKEISTKFWAEVIYYSIYLMNLVSIRVVIKSTLVEKWNGRKPYVRHLKYLDVLLGRISVIDAEINWMQKAILAS